MLLDFIKLRAKHDRNCRVSESERMIFDTLKVIFDGKWVIHNGNQFIALLQEIDVLKHMNE